MTNLLIVVRLYNTSVSIVFPELFLTNGGIFNSAYFFSVQFCGLTARLAEDTGVLGKPHTL